MKRVPKSLIFFLMILLLFISNVNALIISEIESNPEGNDYKNEWIELYSETPIHDEYKLVNNDGDELKIEFDFTGYYIYVFNGRWLDNTDEKVYLYSVSDQLIDTTNLFDDVDNTNDTWQNCGDTWVFEEQTKSFENNCPGQEIPEENETDEDLNESDNETEINETETPSEDQDNEISLENESESNESGDSGVEKVVIEENPETYKNPLSSENTDSKESVTAEVIKLNSKDIKSKSNKEGVDKNKYAMIGLSIIAVLLLLLLFSQRNRKIRQNEFR